MDSSCYTYYVHVAKVEGAERFDLVIPARCKSWGCPTCRKSKARIVKKFIERSFKDQDIWMLTFTDPHMGNALDAWKTLGPRWNLFRTWFAKNYGQFQYVRVIEPHKLGGWPHMHVLVNVQPRETEVRAMLKQWGYGYIYDQMPITTSGASSYVSGYLTKKWPGQLADQMRRETKTRIVQASQSLGAIFAKPSTWRLVKREIKLSDLANYLFDLFEDRYNVMQSFPRFVNDGEDFALTSEGTRWDIQKLGSIDDVRKMAMEEDIEPTLEKISAKQLSLW